MIISQLHERTKEGWKDHSLGKDIDECPEHYNNIQTLDWEHGWVCRNQSVVEGRKHIPHAIILAFRSSPFIKDDSYDDPTVEQADYLCM